MHKRASQALKRTFMHVSGLPHLILIIKLIHKVFGFYHQNMVGEVLKHA